jgi:hypothetical protein
MGLTTAARPASGAGGSASGFDGLTVSTLMSPKTGPGVALGVVSPQAAGVGPTTGSSSKAAGGTGSGTPSGVTSRRGGATGSGPAPGRARSPPPPAAGALEMKGLPSEPERQKAAHGARLPPRVGPGDRSRPRNFTRLALPLVLPERLLASVAASGPGVGTSDDTGAEMVTAVEVAVASQNAVGWSSLSAFSRPVYIKSLPVPTVTSAAY